MEHIKWESEPDPQRAEIEELLLQYWKQGSEEAVEDLERWLEGKVKGHVRKMAKAAHLPLQEEARDVAELALEWIWEAIRSYDPDAGNFFGLLWKVVGRRFIDELRRLGEARKHQEQIGGGAAGGMFAEQTLASAQAPPNSDPSHELQQHEIDEWLRAALDHLDPPERLLCEHWLNDLSARDLAKLLQISECAVKHRLVNLRNRLRSQFKRAFADKKPQYSFRGLPPCPSPEIGHRVTHTASFFP